MKRVEIEQITIEELKQFIEETVANALNEISIQANSRSNEESFISKRKAANMLNISLPTLTKYMKLGKIPVYQIGGRVLFKRNDVINSLTVINANNKGKRS